jgi:sodium-independent sulfate anion transporter 11
MSLFSFQFLTTVKIGPKDGTPLNTTQKVVNKTIWLVGTTRNIIIMIITMVIGYLLEDSKPFYLTGKYHVIKIYTYSHFTDQDTLF